MQTKMFQKYLVLGTDTGVGKTNTTQELAVALRKRGEPVLAVKPLESGVNESNAARSDAALLANASSVAFRNPESFLRFKAPLAPYAATLLGDHSVDYQKLLSDLHGLARADHHLLIEGAGGTLVPITRAKTFADLAKDLGFSAILVSANKLGTISATRCAIESLQSRGVKVAACVLNDISPSAELDPSMQSNAQVLRQLCEVPVIERPYQATSDESDGWIENLWGSLKSQN